MNKQEIEKATTFLKGFIEYAKIRTGLLLDENTEAIQTAISCMEQQLNNGWIPTSERLPEESIDGTTNDFTEYNVSLKFEFAECTRTYKFGDGKWWNSGTDMSKYVIAWKPLPETYKEDTDA